MKRSICVTSAFSLVEVTLALGIAAFCLIAVIGLMPVSVQTNRNATSQTAATNIMASVIADLRATPKPPGGTKSVQYRIVFGTATTLFFDGSGGCSLNVSGSTRVDGSSWVPPLQTRYQLDITWSGSTALQYADLKVRWPPVFVQSGPTPIPSGSTEMFVALDRN